MMNSATVLTIKYTLCSLGVIVAGLVLYWLYFLSTSFNRQQQNMKTRKMDLLHSDNNDLQQVVFIRHGQAIHNTNFRALNKKDAKLTETGIKQIEKLRKMILNEFPTYFDDVELIVVSPLKRTLRSMLVLIGNKLETYKNKISLEPLASERGKKLCDIGISLDDLSLEYPEIKSLENWKKLLESNQKWWTYPESVDEFENRMTKFKLWIQQRPEKTILIVSHDGVIDALTSKRVGNAEMSIVNWERP